MSRRKKKRDDARRPLKPPPPERGRDARFVKLGLHREIRYITQRAQAGDSRIVALGAFVLFSTHTRDAWLLDRDDGFAACLCRDGDPQPARIIEGPDRIAIEWTASFAIDGTAFVVEERSGRMTVIHGYPTAEISAACRAPVADS
jgi:hypothetical protein